MRVQRNAMPVWRGEGDCLTLLKAGGEAASQRRRPAAVVWVPAFAGTT